MYNREALIRKLLRNQDSLLSFTRNNPWLKFKERKAPTLSLSSLNSLETGSAQENDFIPFSNLHFVDAVKTQEFDVEEHFSALTKRDRTFGPKLQKKFKKLRAEDRKIEKERGSSGAWLLGPFLCWRTTQSKDDADIWISPLFTIPVDLEQRKGGWVLRLEKNTISLNPALRVALKRTYQIDLAEELPPNGPNEIRALLAEAFAASKRSLNWVPSRFDLPSTGGKSASVRRGVIDDDIEPTPACGNKQVEHCDPLCRDVTPESFLVINTFCVDVMDPSNMALYSDYQPILDNPEAFPLVVDFVLGEEAGMSAGNSALPTTKALNEYRENENHFVVDVDATQHKAVVAATNGKGIVIQGPPGTGKSQTITNIIAQCMAKGEKVLFVAQKKAALDVVINRLGSARLERYAIALGPSNQNRKEIYESFARLAKGEPEALVTEEWEETSSRLSRVKERIATAKSTFGEMVAASGLCVADVLTLHAEVGDQPVDHELIKGLVGFSYKSVQTLGVELDEVIGIIRSIPEYDNHPWRKRKEGVRYSKELIDSLKRTTEKIVELEATVDKHRHAHRQRFGREMGRDELEILNNLWEGVPRDLHRSRIATEILSSCAKGRTLGVEIERLQAKLRKTAKARNAVQPKASLKELQRAVELGPPAGLLWRLSNRGRRYSKAVKTLGACDRPSHKVLEQALEYETALRAWRRKAKDLDLSAPLADFAKLERSLDETKSAVAALTKIAEFRESRDLQLCPDSACVGEEKERLDAQREQEKIILATISQYFEEVPGCLGGRLTPEAIRCLIERVNDLGALDKLASRRQNIMERFPGVDLDLLLTKLVGLEEPCSTALLRQMVNFWLDCVYKQFPQVCQFSPKDLEADLQTFSSAVEEHLKQAQTHVSNLCVERSARVSGESSALSIIERESRKVKGHISIREAMERGAKELLLTLKSCWLMTPEAIVEVLPQEPLFDVVIFDEASQIRMEVATSVLGRAKRAVIVGDIKQMPPTSFFASKDDDDVDCEEDEPFESLLDYALLRYPDILLEWHYRSRHDALIAFSNRAFYGGLLVATPSTSDGASASALRFVQVSNATFSQPNGNPVEAEQIARLVEETLDAMPTATLGVICPGKCQVDAVEKALEKRAGESPEFRRRLEAARDRTEDDVDVGFFVKELENVQGDERDIIILGVGYAPPRLGASLRKQFGPISSKGGERRLNVAITRAREKMIVVTSFDPNEIDISEEGATATFGRYLQYAKAVADGDNQGAGQILDMFPMAGVLTQRKPSRFNLAVKRRLEELGYLVSTEVGSCGYFIDLGIHHPSFHRRFILGIECDGAIFHSSEYARERDRARERLLRSRGWQIARIWSTDWSRDWRREVERIDRIIRDLIGRDDQVEPQQTPFSESLEEAVQPST